MYSTNGGNNHNDLELQNLTSPNLTPFHDDNCPLQITRGASILRQNSLESQNTQNGTTLASRFDNSSSFFTRMKILGGRQDSISGSRYVSILRH